MTTAFYCSFLVAICLLSNAVAHTLSNSVKDSSSLRGRHRSLESNDQAFPGHRDLHHIDGAPSTVPEGIWGLELVDTKDAPNFSILRYLQDGDVINTAVYATEEFNIRARVEGGIGLSAVFELDGEYVNTDSVGIFSLSTRGIKFSDGVHTVTASLYSLAGGLGSVINTISVHFTVESTPTGALSIPVVSAR